MKKITKILTSLSLVLLLLVTQVIHGVHAADTVLTILFTNDVHGRVEETVDKGVTTAIGYARVAGYKDYLNQNGHSVILADAGDAIQGEPIAGLTKGDAIVDIMNAMGYDFLVPGNHEFDYTMDTFLDLTNKYEDLNYYSCNFVNLPDKTPVFEPYKMFKNTAVGNVALVGVSTPESFTKSTPKYFQDENGNYIYGFCEGNDGQDLYDAVQDAVDAAKDADADYVIAVGHVGIDKQSSPWTSKEIIANTTGIDAFIDGHSHSQIDNEKVKNSEGKEITLMQTGTKLATVGQLDLEITPENGLTITPKLVTGDELKELGVEPESVVEAYIKGVLDEFDEILNAKVCDSEVLLNDEDENGKRLVRTTPTNLGDLCADAYRYIMGADIGFMNGGGIRKSIQKGEVTFDDVVKVFPYSNSGTLIEVTGQQILDALEMSCSVWPEENGGFLHTSGLTYEFHSYLDSKVVKDDKKVFVKVDGEYRVKNVKVNGEPLDLKKTYKLASHDYMLKNCGDGYSMFEGSKVLKDATIIDNQLLIQYIQENLGGKITEKQYGKVRESRILVEKAPEKPVQPVEPPVEPPVEQPVNPKPDRPNTSDPYSYYTYGSMAIASLAAIGLFSKKRKHL